MNGDKSRLGATRGSVIEVAGPSPRVSNGEPVISDSVDRVDAIVQDGATFGDPDDKYIYRYLHNELGYVPADKSFGTWVSLEKGNFEFLSGADIDFGRFDVREELKYWGAWLAKEIGADGVRLDAVKHYTANYSREWIGHVRAQVGRPLFAVAEYISGDTGPLHSYLTAVSAAGDFPRKYRCLTSLALQVQERQLGTRPIRSPGPEPRHHDGGATREGGDVRRES